jgi:putative sterol carrier protein
MTDVLPYLEKIKGKFDDPLVQEKMTGFTKSLQFVFPDLSETYVLTIENGKTAVLEKKTLEAPDIAITWNSDVFTGIQDKTVNPTNAFMSGKLKIKGNMEDLMKLQKFMM